MAHCPTCQQQPGVGRILWATYFGRKGKRFECPHCERGVAVPVWQRRAAWLWLLVGPLVGGVVAVGYAGWSGLWVAPLLAPIGPLIWASCWARVVRPADAMMAKPPRRHSRKHRRKQELL